MLQGRLYGQGFGARAVRQGAHVASEQGRSRARWHLLRQGAPGASEQGCENTRLDWERNGAYYVWKYTPGVLTARSVTTDAYLRCFPMIWELGLDFALIWDSVMTSFGARL